jgi:hypothetical protein
MSRLAEQLRIDARYEGIPGVTLGGYVAGLAARGLGLSAVVTLQAAVPPETLVTVEGNESTAVLRVDGMIAATAAREAFASTAPEPITASQAEEASERYPGFGHHFFPRCFTCGPHRSVEEGLRIFPGSVDDQALVASLWTPPSIALDADGAVGTEYLWAALDCPAIWAVILHGSPQADDRAVTGRLALNRLEVVAGGSPYVIAGWPIGRDGRRVIAGAGIFSQAGELLVEARQTMILTDRGVPLALAAWEHRSPAAAV